MYDYFQGNLTSINATQVTVECQGVGYQFQISLYTYASIKEKKQIRLYAHLVVREDAHILYGFADEGERIMFRELLNVSGVGATTSRIILSSMNPAELQQVIAMGDVVTLQRIKGIGTKTAQRIVVDLQDKMKKGAGISIKMPPGMHNTTIDEALSALLTLGFARASADKALQQAVRTTGKEPSIEDLLKVALSYL